MKLKQKAFQFSEFYITCTFSNFGSIFLYLKNCDRWFYFTSAILIQEQIHEKTSENIVKVQKKEEHQLRESVLIFI